MKRQRLFVHSLPPSLFGPVLGESALTGLSHRALALAEPDDVVLLETQPDSGYLDYLNSIGRGPKEIHIPRPGPRTLVERVVKDESLLSELAGRPWIIEPYFAGTFEQQLASRLEAALHGSETDIAANVNHKARLSLLLRSIGLPNVQTLLATREELTATVSSGLKSGPLIVRADVGIGGTGVFLVRKAEDLRTLSEGMESYIADDLFLVQPLLKTRSSPNVQFDIHDDKIEVIGASEQRLRNGIHHEGNLFPLSDARLPEVLQQGLALARSLAEQGYRGYVGIDFIITNDDQVFAIEINPRLNTSSFGLLSLGAKPGLTQLSLSSIQTPDIDSFEAFHALLPSDAWIGKDRAHGVFPILPPSADRSRADVVVVGDSEKDVEARAETFLASIAEQCESSAPPTALS